MSDDATSLDPALETIAVVGVGLIGGSIAAAVKERRMAERVIGIGRDAQRLEAACDAGLLDRYDTKPRAAAEADLAIVCTPVDRIVDDVSAVAAHLRPGGLVTDAGSVKTVICRAVSRLELPAGVTFIGAHPLAGSEKAGWEHADAGLFEGRICVVAPTEDAPVADCTRVETFWLNLGMRVVRMSPESHDRALGFTSHLPHVVAAALASLLTDDVQHLASTGFRDTTRVAGGDARLWTAIFLNNPEPLTEDIDRFIERLIELRTAIDEGDEERLRELLTRASTQRRRLD
ncbi:MAG: prephenate dehydrogenase [Planctomycetota bacterium]|nr:MAG: prephenate dehydrogenase [Planctomycetota bacterium]REJ88064.1 MAG: prephenate dehydrogenase [Planctomycetota bacterium]REK24189.1 MAG: prephenate dehydrogenase [Planctomycetota bacterium]REK28823.1 MAG: prephenate dehydrogenase [Planctomycetota bacterium]